MSRGTCLIISGDTGHGYDYKCIIEFTMIYEKFTVSNNEEFGVTLGHDLDIGIER